jgi:hypothetical protein
VALNEVAVVLRRAKWSEFVKIFPVNKLRCAVIEARMKHDD